ncbi:MAG: hypothetical protein JWM07_906 [Candidatus Saccharibacteria bacterium]|nr:hypothetical protein [Candidatus Saccharibacteria bacterium]
MTERFTDTNNRQQAKELRASDLLNDIHTVDDQRYSVAQEAGHIDATVVNHSLDKIADQYLPENTISDKIKMLAGCITVVEKQLAVLELKSDDIKKRMEAPLRMRNKLTKLLEQMHEREVEIVRRTQELGRQKNSAEKNAEMKKLRDEANFTISGTRKRASEALVSADVEINRLTGILSIVDDDKSLRQENLVLYESNIRLLNDRVERAAAAMGRLASAMSEVVAIADEEDTVGTIEPPAALHDFEIDEIGQPVSYGEYTPIDYTEQTLASDVLHHPGNTFNATTTPTRSVEIDVPYVHIDMSQEIIAAQKPLEDRLRAAASKNTHRPITPPKKKKFLRFGV